jgi:hypothetical protein
VNKYVRIDATTVHADGEKIKKLKIKKLKKNYFRVRADVTSIRTDRKKKLIFL